MVSAQAEHFVDSLLATMSLDEKLGQLTQVPGQGTPTGPKALPGTDDEIRAGHIGSFLGVYGAETTRELQRVAVESSPHHIPLLFSHDVIHGFRTIFPVPLGEAASWDPALAMRAARVAADEATSAGVHWTFAPMVDIARDPRWGRIVEGSGEDPYLGSLLAAARVRGFQGDDLAANNTLMATVKHFVAYGAAEGGRDYNVADISPQSLHDVYLPPFHAAVDAGAWSVMASFNEVGGTPMHANRSLIDGLLRAQWGWDGVLVSDYTGVLELINHGVAADSADAARLSINAGVDVDMVSQFFRKALPGEVRAGRVSVATVDSAVRRVLLAKYSLGLFADPYRYADVAREKATLLTPAHREASRAMAREAIVLLKNAPLGARPVLPLAKTVRNVAVIGALAADGKSANGNWWGDGRADEAVTVLDGIRHAVSGTSRVTYAKGAEATGTDTSGFAEARRVARAADVVILVVGEREDQSAEAESRSSIELSGMQEQLVRHHPRARQADRRGAHERSSAGDSLDRRTRPRRRRVVVPRERDGERAGRRPVRRRESERQAPGHHATRDGAGPDVLRAQAHRAPAARRGEVHVQVQRPSLDAAVSVWTWVELHHVPVRPRRAQQCDDGGARLDRRERGAAQYRHEGGGRGGAALRAGRGRECHAPGEGVARVPPRRTGRRRVHARVIHARAVGPGVS